MYTLMQHIVQLLIMRHLKSIPLANRLIFCLFLLHHSFYLFCQSFDLRHFGFQYFNQKSSQNHIFFLVIESLQKFPCSVKLIPLFLSYFHFLEFISNYSVLIKFFQVLSSSNKYFNFVQYAPLWDV